MYQWVYAGSGTHVVCTVDEVFMHRALLMTMSVNSAHTPLGCTLTILYYSALLPYAL